MSSSVLENWSTFYMMLFTEMEGENKNENLLFLMHTIKFKKNYYFIYRWFFGN